MSAFRLLLLLPLVLPASCAYPICKQLKPAARVSVHDTSEVPIAGAKVHLWTIVHPHNRRGLAEVTETDASGIARFHKKVNGVLRRWSCMATTCSLGGGVSPNPATRRAISVTMSGSAPNRRSSYEKAYRNRVRRQSRRDETLGS